MRISDWSSDVCSSDLGQSENDSSGGGCPQKRDVSDSAPVTAAHYARRWLCQRSRPDSTLNNMPNALGASTWSPKNAQPMTDRKRVVSGKSVAGRVDRGGRGSIKKKTKDKQSCN